MWPRPPHWPLASLSTWESWHLPAFPPRGSDFEVKQLGGHFSSTVLPGLGPGASFLNRLDASFFIRNMVSTPMLQEDLFTQ